MRGAGAGGRASWLTRAGLLWALLSTVGAVPARADALFVQLVGTRTANTAGTTTVITSAVTVFAGDVIVVAFVGDTANATGVTDTRGSTYTQLAAHDVGNGEFYSSIWAAPVTTTLLPGDTITVTSGSTAVRLAAAYDYYGVAVPLVVSTSVNRDFSADFDTGQATGNTGDLMFGLFGSGSGGGFAPTGGSTLRTDLSASNGIVVDTLTTVDMIIPGGGSYGATGMVPAETFWAGELAILRAAAGAPTPTASPTATATPTATRTPTSTATSTATASATATATVTSTTTATAIATATPTATATGSPAATATPTVTTTGTQAATATASASATSVPTSTGTPTALATPTPTATPAATRTPTPVIPEPPAWLLFAVGLAPLLWLARRRR